MSGRGTATEAKGCGYVLSREAELEIDLFCGIARAEMCFHPLDKCPDEHVGSAENYTLRFKNGTVENARVC